MKEISQLMRILILMSVLLNFIHAIKDDRVIVDEGKYECLVVSESTNGKWRKLPEEEVMSQDFMIIERFNSPKIIVDGKKYKYDNTLSTKGTMIDNYSRNMKNGKKAHLGVWHNTPLLLISDKEKETPVLIRCWKPTEELKETVKNETAKEIIKKDINMCKTPYVLNKIEKTVSSLPIQMDSITKLATFACVDNRYFYGIEIDAVKGDYREKDLEEYYKQFQKYADSVSVQTKGVIKATYTIMYKNGEIMKVIVGN